MFTEPLVNDSYNQIWKEGQYNIEIDVWINKVTKKKHLMVYIHPLGTFIGDDLWTGFKFRYSEIEDKEIFLKKLMSKYQKSIATSKRKGTLVQKEVNSA
jgi:hypothetical protein